MRDDTGEKAIVIFKFSLNDFLCHKEKGLYSERERKSKELNKAGR